MLRLLMGLLLIGISFVLLFMFIADPAQNNLVQQVQTALHCQPGETFRQELGRYIDNIGTSGDGYELHYYCENNDGEQRDVTGAGVLTIAAAFVVPFLLGLLMTMWGTMALMWKGTRQLIQGVAGVSNGGITQPQMFYNSSTTGTPVTSSATFVTVDGKQVDPSTLSPEQQAKIKQAFDMLGMQMPQTGNAISRPPSSSPMSGEDLVTRLQQLEAARNQNLISQEEYDRLRKEILNGLV